MAKIQQQKQAAEQKRQQEAARVAELERQRKAEEARLAEIKRRQQEEERKRLAEQQRREAEAKRKAEEARRLAVEQEIAAQLALEEQALAQERQRLLATQVNEYKAAIRNKLQRNWLRPLNWQPGTVCTLRVRLFPDGGVISARIVKSSGNVAFDDSAIRAVNKASPFALPSDAELRQQFVDFNLEFKPEA